MTVNELVKVCVERLVSVRINTVVEEPLIVLSTVIVETASVVKVADAVAVVVS